MLNNKHIADDITQHKTSKESIVATLAIVLLATVFARDTKLINTMQCPCLARAPGTREAVWSTVCWACWAVHLM